MKRELKIILVVIAFLNSLPVFTQRINDSSILTIERIYSGEFRQDYERDIQWIENGDAYVTIEKSESVPSADELVRYSSTDQHRSVFVPAEVLSVEDKSLPIESFSLSHDGTKVLIFNNSARVWRSRSRGDFWVFDLESKSLKQLGSSFEPSSLMFAKFSSDNTFVFYVHKFNIYMENFITNEVTPLTSDGNGDIINGTFDWVYEEEFGKRDGFTVSPADSYMAFWQLDASEIGTFYMINNTDSIYSKPIPIQYPKVGQDPSAAKIGMIDLKSKQKHWIPLEGGEKENYIPGIQWVNDDLVLIQQINRHQNHLIIWSYNPSAKQLKRVYAEREETWVDLNYPDVSSSNWGNNDLPLVERGNSFLRMTETDTWRQIYKIDIKTGTITPITPFDYDIASIKRVAGGNVYFMASPENSTQRYLYSKGLNGDGKTRRITPENFSGLNNYDISPNGLYAFHTHQSATAPRTVRFVRLPGHQTQIIVVDNKDYTEKLNALTLPEVRFYR